MQFKVSGHVDVKKSRFGTLTKVRVIADFPTLFLACAVAACHVLANYQAHFIKVKKTRLCCSKRKDNPVLKILDTDKERKDKSQLKNIKCLTNILIPFESS